MKDELGEKIIRTFVGLWAKTYIYLIEEALEDKKAKATKKWVAKRNLHLKTIKTVQLENKIHQFNIDDPRVFIRNNESITKHSKDLKVNGIMVLLKKLISLL